MRNLLTSQFQNPPWSRETSDSPRKPGLYHYVKENANEKSRIHLRIDADAHGTLIVNASSVMHLNPTAALMAFLVLEDVDERHALKTIQKEYRVSKTQARHDLTSFRLQLSELIRPDGACPIHELDLESRMPFSARPSAPYNYTNTIITNTNAAPMAK